MQKFLVPKEGVIVRDPGNYNPLPVDGALVDWNGNAGRFWRRRVRCGDASIKEVEIEVIEEEEEEAAEPLPSKRNRGNRK
jgi:hypothetical protein